MNTVLDLLVHGIVAGLIVLGVAVAWCLCLEGWRAARGGRPW